MGESIYLFFTSSLSFISLFSFSFFFIFLLRSHITRRNTKTPCPSSYPLLGNIIAFLQNRHRFHDWVTDMLSATPSNTIEVHGFLGTSRGICTTNPTNIEHLLRTNFSNFVKGSRFHDNLHDLLGDGIFNVDNHLWTSQRKIASHEFNTRSLKLFVAEIVRFEISHRLLPYLKNACARGETINLQDIFKKFAFDNICNLAFGEDPAWLEVESNQSSINSASTSAFVQAFDDAIEICSSRLMAPLPLIWKIKRFLNVGSEKRLREAIRIIDEFAMKIIKSKEGENEVKERNQDLLSRFMYSEENQQFRDPDEKRKFLRDIIISFILAGKDSTSTALTWFFWLISENPRCEGLIYTELSSMAAKNESSGIFNYEDLKKLNYLHAAISESLRLFPPVPINSRLTVADDVLPDGTYVGAGWFADYSAYAVGRMKEVWGPDCREFKPERWLDDNGVFVPCDQFRFPVFHGGPRMCLGKEMAYVQMKSVAASVIYGFKVELINGGDGGGKERIKHPSYTLSLLLKMKGELQVCLKKRSQQAY